MKFNKLIFTVTTYLNRIPKLFKVEVEFPYSHKQIILSKLLTLTSKKKHRENPRQSKFKHMSRD